MSTNQTALAAPALPCCAFCSNPRSSEEFIKNHVRTHVEPPEDSTECCICLTPWGTVDTRICVPDVPNQIVNLPGCTHTFGWCWIVKIIAEDGTCCPLCRTPWFDPNPDTPASQREHIETFVWCLSTDLTTARLALTHDPVLQDQVSEITRSITGAVFYKHERISQAMNTQTMEDFLEDLGIITIVAIRVLKSINGERLQEQAKRTVEEKLDEYENGAMTEEELLQHAEDEWMAWYGDVSVRVFSRFLLRLKFELIFAA
ncbi:hypothetical protein Ptr902_09716 [Pyrenophora tritici-repentis]|nr:hypothetical protein Ptr902_09716 [Pyrenophora tritici-repentis]